MSAAESTGEMIGAMVGGGIFGLVFAWIAKLLAAATRRSFQPDFMKWALIGASLAVVAELGKKDEHANTKARSSFSEGCAHGCEKRGGALQYCQSLCECLMRHLEEEGPAAQRATFWTSTNPEAVKKDAARLSEKCVSEIGPPK